MRGGAFKHVAAWMFDAWLQDTESRHGGVSREVLPDRSEK